MSPKLQPTRSLGKRSVRAVRRLVGGLFFIAFLVVLATVLVLNLRDSSPRLTSPEARGWGSPGAPNSAQGAAFADRMTVVISAGGVRVRVHRSAASTFEGFLNELRATGYLIRQGDTGAYNHREKRCTVRSSCAGQLSSHSWGVALDVNWNSNPQASNGSCEVITDYPEEVRSIAKRWGLYWGADFSCPNQDPMHFEVLGTPEQAEERAARNVAAASS